MKNNTKNKYEIGLLSHWVDVSLIMCCLLLLPKEMYMLLFFIGIIQLIIFFYNYRKIYSSNRWHKTKGKYKKYQIDCIYFQNSFFRQNDFYRPYCLYTYEVDGKTYTNDKLSILNKDFLIHKQFKDNANHIIPEFAIENAN